MRKVLLALTMILVLMITGCEAPHLGDYETLGDYYHDIYKSVEHPNEEVYIIPIEYFFIEDIDGSLNNGEKFDTDEYAFTLLFEKENHLLTLKDPDDDIYGWIYQKGIFIYVIIKDLSDGIGEWNHTSSLKKYPQQPKQSYFTSSARQMVQS